MGPLAIKLETKSLYRHLVNVVCTILHAPAGRDHVEHKRALTCRSSVLLPLQVVRTVNNALLV